MMNCREVVSLGVFVAVLSTIPATDARAQPGFSSAAPGAQAFITKVTPDLGSDPPTLLIQGVRFGADPAVYQGSGSGVNQLFLEYGGDTEILARLAETGPCTYLLVVVPQGAMPVFFEFTINSISGREKVVRTLGEVVVDAGTEVVQTVPCPGRKLLLGGGCESANIPVVLMQSYPFTDDTWLCRYYNTDTQMSRTTTLNAYAICVDVAP